MEEGQEAIPCGECGTENLAGTAFCTGCGVSLRTKPGPDRGRRGGGDAMERSRARHEFARIKSSVFTLRAMYWAGTALAVVQVLLFLVMAKDLPEDAWLLLQVFAFAQLGLMVAGSLLVMRAPFVWAMVVACYWTIDSLLSWWLMDFAVPPGLLLKFGMTVAVWVVVGRAARVQKLLTEFPELQLVRKRIAADERVVGGVADDARARRREERRRATVARLRMLAIVGAVAVLGGVASWWVTRPPTAHATVARFAERWAAADLDALAGMLPGGRGSVELREGMIQRGWHSHPPALERKQEDAREQSHTVTWSTADGDLRVAFSRNERGWHLTDVRFPPVAFLPLAPAIDAFRRAWAAGPEALGAMFRDDSRVRSVASLQRIFEKRGWSERRPALGDASPTEASTPRVSVRFDVDGEDMSVRFEFWHPEWRVTGVRPPRE